LNSAVRCCRESLEIDDIGRIRRDNKSQFDQTVNARHGRKPAGRCVPAVYLIVKSRLSSSSAGIAPGRQFQASCIVRLRISRGRTLKVHPILCTLHVLTTIAPNYISLRSYLPVADPPRVAVRGRTATKCPITGLRQLTTSLSPGRGVFVACLQRKRILHVAIRAI